LEYERKGTDVFGEVKADDDPREKALRKTSPARKAKSGYGFWLGGGWLGRRFDIKGFAIRERKIVQLKSVAASISSPGKTHPGKQLARRKTGDEVGLNCKKGRQGEPPF